MNAVISSHKTRGEAVRAAEGFIADGGSYICVRRRRPEEYDVAEYVVTTEAPHDEGLDILTIVG